MTELKRCPFCGAEAELVRNSSGSYFARCTNKQCAAKTRLYHENEVGARIAWNKRAEPARDRDALLALAEVLSTPELETDCGTCPLRKWCEEARDSGNRITCFECKLWHTADSIREACGEEAKDEA